MLNIQFTKILSMNKSYRSTQKLFKVIAGGMKEK